MTSLGQGSDEVTEVAVPVLAEAPAATGQSWVVTQSSADGTTTSQPRRSGRDKPGDRAGGAEEQRRAVCAWLGGLAPCPSRWPADCSGAAELLVCASGGRLSGPFFPTFFQL